MSTVLDRARDIITSDLPAEQALVELRKLDGEAVLEGGVETYFALSKMAEPLVQKMRTTEQY